MIAPATNQYMSVRGPVGDLGHMVLVIMSSALAVVVARVAVKAFAEHRRAAREELLRQELGCPPLQKDGLPRAGSGANSRALTRPGTQGGEQIGAFPGSAMMTV
jgi:hypothetical protein